MDPSGEFPIPLILILIGLGLMGGTTGCAVEPDIIPTPDASVGQSIVGINIDEHPLLSDAAIGVALGTVVSNRRTIVTAKHNIPLTTSNNARVKFFPLGSSQSVNNTVEYDLSQLKLKYANSTDMVTITVPQDIPGNIVPAIPASGYQFAKGDYLTITGQPRDDSWNVGVAIARVNLTGINPTTLSTGDQALVATADDLTGFSQGGDSGGGVFYNNLYVGLISGGADWSSGPVVYIAPYELR